VDKHKSVGKSCGTAKGSSKSVAFTVDDSFDSMDLLAVLGGVTIPLLDLAETAFGRAALQELFTKLDESSGERLSISSVEIESVLRQWRGPCSDGTTICVVLDVPGYRVVQWRHNIIADVWSLDHLEKNSAGRILLKTSPGKLSGQVETSSSEFILGSLVGDAEGSRGIRILCL
jgi:hypothetical protein